MKNELQNIIQGKGGNGNVDMISKITGYLRAGKASGDSDDQYS